MQREKNITERKQRPSALASGREGALPSNYVMTNRFCEEKNIYSLFYKQSRMNTEKFNLLRNTQNVLGYNEEAHS